MFERGYEFKPKQTNKGKSEDLFNYNHVFTFLCKNRKKYIVNVEEYDFHTFIIKFYLASHKHSDNKYRKLTNQQDASAVLRTCIDIMLYFYNSNPYSSFGFTGADMEGEEKSNNKRFRVYKGIMTRFFSPIKFDHRQLPRKNVYFIINKDSSEEKLVQKIIDMFAEYYDF